VTPVALAPDAATRQGGQGRGEIIADIRRDLRIIRVGLLILMALSFAILFLV
jgi:hypothetical protein